MTITTTVRTLAGATLIALAVAGASFGQVSAESKTPPKNGATCAIPGSQLAPPSGADWDFFVPGDIVIARDSKGGAHILRCGEDGNWYAALTLPSGGVVAPAPVGNKAP